MQRILGLSASLLVGMLALSLTGCGSGGQAEAELVNARLEPWTNHEGKAMQMVYVEWKNTGTSPIRKVKADINLFDAAGNKLITSAPDYFIYVASNSETGVAPGETYIDPSGEGYAVPPTTPATRVDVQITTVAEEGANY